MQWLVSTLSTKHRTSCPLCFPNFSFTALSFFFATSRAVSFSFRAVRRSFHLALRVFIVAMDSFIASFNLFGLTNVSSLFQIISLIMAWILLAPWSPPKTISMLLKPNFWKYSFPLNLNSICRQSKIAWSIYQMVMASLFTTTESEIGCNAPVSSSRICLSGTVSHRPKKLERWRRIMRWARRGTFASSHIAHAEYAFITFERSKIPREYAEVMNASWRNSPKYHRIHSAASSWHPDLAAARRTSSTHLTRLAFHLKWL
jgi:hypothetical protein